MKESEFVSENPFLHEPVADDADDPDDEDAEGDPVEIALGDAGGAGRRGDATAEHVGDSAALALVHEHREREEDAREHDEDEQDDLQCGHVGSDSSMRAAQRPGDGLRGV